MRHIALLVCLLVPFSAHSADIARIPNASGMDIIAVTGVLNVGDEAIFRNVAAASDKAFVVLDSEGGAVKTGLEIGRVIRLKGFGTAVGPDSLCASACALTWLAGSPRILERTSKLGFHAAYVVTNGKASESGVGNALVGAYLNQLGLPENVIEYVTSAPPEGIEWLTADKASRLGIAFTSLMDQGEPSIGAPDKIASYDPMGTVVAFYSALSAADGETASALVVPEKRGKGPFNESSIHAFFGAMSQPLILKGVSRLGPDGVRASYAYVTDKGRECQGRADVKTIYQFGKTLIQQIKALDGC